MKSRPPEIIRKLPMTPLIDIVFLLLVFFVMTFKVSAQEGDFSIKMPLYAPGGGFCGDDEPPLTIRLTEKEDALDQIYFNGSPIKDFQSLRLGVLEIVGDTPGLRKEWKAKIDCDYDLPYKYAVGAMTALRGREPDGRIVQLIERVEFMPPRAKKISKP